MSNALWRKNQEISNVSFKLKNLRETLLNAYFPISLVSLYWDWVHLLLLRECGSERIIIVKHVYWRPVLSTIVLVPHAHKRPMFVLHTVKSTEVKNTGVSKTKTIILFVLTLFGSLHVYFFVLLSASFVISRTLTCNKNNIYLCIFKPIAA
jgi:hypothetical protein